MYYLDAQHFNSLELNYNAYNLIVQHDYISKLEYSVLRIYVIERYKFKYAGIALSSNTL